jgi:hypothetical protein
MDIEYVINFKNLIQDEIFFIDKYLNYQQLFNKHNLEFIQDYFKTNKYTEEVLEKKKHLLNKINIYIKENCQHSFIDDFIDIDPEKTVKIRYCQFCEYTQNI